MKTQKIKKINKRTQLDVEQEIIWFLCHATKYQTDAELIEYAEMSY